MPASKTELRKIRPLIIQIIVAVWIGWYFVMHELSIVKSLARAALSEFDPEKMEKILTLTVVMGAMRDYEEEWLKKYLADVAKDTPLEGVRLKLEKLPVTFKCRKCGHIFPMELSGDSDVGCPGCGSYEYDMQTGKEFYISQMTVQEKD